MIQHRPKCITLDYWRVLPLFLSPLHLDIQNKLDRRREPLNGYVEIKSISDLSGVVGL
jgi:hypothetical protein